MSLVEGNDIFVGICGDVLRAILSNDAEKISSIRVESKTVSFLYAGKPHHIYVATSGLCFSSLHQPKEN
jgi:hypothetical protein